MDWLVYVVGYPGSGKTTAMQKAIGLADGFEHDRLLQTEPFAHTVYASGIVELGRQRTTYGGTDALPLNAQPVVEQWLSEIDVPVIVAEGDRLANRKFFNAACGYNEMNQECDSRYLCFVHIKCPEIIARKRAWERGSRFNEAWLKGRISKVNSLVRAASKPYIFCSQGRYNTSDYKEWKEPVDLTLNVFSTMAGAFHEIAGTQPPDDVATELRAIIETLNNG